MKMESRGETEGLLALSLTGTWELDLAAEELSWSETTGRLHGQKLTTLDAFLAALDPADRETITAVATDGGTFSFSYKWMVDGQVRHLRVHGRSEAGADGRPERLVGTVQDVTADTLAREALTRANETSAAASRIKSQFLANMSHEIRTPMNAVLGMMSLLLDTELTATQRTYAVAAKSAGDTLLGLLNDILDLSKIEAGKLQLEHLSFDVREVLESVVSVFRLRAESKGLDLTTDIDTSIPATSFGDPLRIRQVFMNLVGNAVKFTAKGSVRVRVWQDGELLRATVADTGIGIGKDALALVFEPFRQADGATTRKFGGSGLGLSIAKELVERMGGNVTVQSKAGEGTIFEVAIRAPAFFSSGAPQTVRRPPSIRMNRVLRVLVAEDDDANALLTRALLTKLGHVVVRARDGLEVLELTEKDTFDVIFMDVQMPELDGLEATQRFRAREAGSGIYTPIVALTANAMKGDDILCLDAGMDAYVTKPVDLAALGDAIARLAA